MAIFHVVGMQTCRALVAHKNQWGALGAAHRRSSVSACVAAAIRGEAVQMLGAQVIHSVRGGVGRHIVGNHPMQTRMLSQG